MASHNEENLIDINVFVKQKAHKDLSENNSKCVVEFSASSYAVLESEKTCKIIIERYGNLEKEISFWYDFQILYYDRHNS